MVYIELENESQLNVLINQEFPLVLKFGASWCGPCKRIQNDYHNLSQQYDAIFVSIDIDKFDTISTELGIESVPTFLIYKDAQIIKRVEGTNLKEIESAIHALT